MTVLDRKTVVVAGGAGFIGSHLCERLVKQKHRVICVDNLHTGSYRNLAAISFEQDFVFIEHDVTAPLFIPEPIHRIYNLACPASRSEEHTSELQSLMRISYTVFCLKKKKELTS